MLRTIFGPKRDKATRESRRIHNEELHVLCFSTNIRFIKSRIMRWTKHVARMAREKVKTRFWWGNLREETTWKTQA